MATNDVTSHEDDGTLSKFNLGAFIVKKVLPALGSLVVAGAVAFATSYLKVRDSLSDLKHDQETTNSQVSDIKSTIPTLATKEAEALKDSAIQKSLDQLDKRAERIERTQNDILMRLPRGR